MKVYFCCLFMVIGLMISGCEKIVDIEEAEPDPVEYCELDEALEGVWISDSVHITTQVDTIDSLIENKESAIVYQMIARCNDIKRFNLTYFNGAGVQTYDINSTNYKTADGRIYLFRTFDETQDTADATFSMNYELFSDSAGVFTFRQAPNEVQVSEYRLYMTKE